MKLTVAISTHGAYSQFLEEAAASALEYGDEVIIYDDGGECSPVKGCRYVALPKTGSCTMARRAAIAEASHEKIVHLDGDDWLSRRPPMREEEWVFSDITLSTGEVWWYGFQEYSVDNAWRYLFSQQETPVCGKSVYDIGWLRRNNLSWYEFPNTQYAEDCRTEIEYLKHDPRIVYVPDHSFYTYRQHEGQQSNDKERHQAYKDDLGVCLEHHRMYHKPRLFKILGEVD